MTDPDRSPRAPKLALDVSPLPAPRGTTTHPPKRVSIPKTVPDTVLSPSSSDSSSASSTSSSEGPVAVTEGSSSKIGVISLAGVSRDDVDRHDLPERDKGEVHYESYSMELKTDIYNLLRRIYRLSEISMNKPSHILATIQKILYRFVDSAFDKWLPTIASYTNYHHIMSSDKTEYIILNILRYFWSYPELLVKHFHYTNDNGFLEDKLVILIGDNITMAKENRLFPHVRDNNSAPSEIDDHVEIDCGDAVPGSGYTLCEVTWPPKSMTDAMFGGGHNSMRRQKLLNMSRGESVARQIFANHTPDGMSVFSDDGSDFADIDSHNFFGSDGRLYTGDDL